MVFAVVAHRLAEQIGHEFHLMLNQPWLVHDFKVMPQIRSGINPLVEVGDDLAEGIYATILVKKRHAVLVLMANAGFGKVNGFRLTQNTDASCL
jgi:hypothetical protein